MPELEVRNLVSILQATDLIEADGSAQSDDESRQVRQEAARAVVENTLQSIKPAELDKLVELAQAYHREAGRLLGKDGHNPPPPADIVILSGRSAEILKEPLQIALKMAGAQPEDFPQFIELPTFAGPLYGGIPGPNSIFYKEFTENNIRQTEFVAKLATTLIEFPDLGKDTASQEWDIDKINKTLQAKSPDTVDIIKTVRACDANVFAYFKDVPEAQRQLHIWQECYRSATQLVQSYGTDVDVLRSFAQELVAQYDNNEFKKNTHGVMLPLGEPRVKLMKIWYADLVAQLKSKDGVAPRITFFDNAIVSGFKVSSMIEFFRALKLDKNLSIDILFAQSHYPTQLPMGQHQFQVLVPKPRDSMFDRELQAALGEYAKPHDTATSFPVQNKSFVYTEESEPRPSDEERVVAEYTYLCLPELAEEMANQVQQLLDDIGRSGIHAFKAPKDSWYIAPQLLQEVLQLTDVPLLPQHIAPQAERTATDQESEALQALFFQLQEIIRKYDEPLPTVVVESRDTYWLALLLKQSPQFSEVFKDLNIIFSGDNEQLERLEDQIKDGTFTQVIELIDQPKPDPSQTVSSFAFRRSEPYTLQQRFEHASKSKSRFLIDDELLPGGQDQPNQLFSLEQIPLATDQPQKRDHGRDTIEGFLRYFEVMGSSYLHTPEQNLTFFHWMSKLQALAAQIPLDPTES